MVLLAYLVIGLCAYLLGSIPTGYLVARSRGIDLRRVGSGNIGATNAMRVLGKPLGILVLVADAAKGALACVGAPGLGGWVAGASRLPTEWAMIVAGLGAILGHNYTCWLRFKGGKGIATSAGVLLVLMPKALGICFGVWALVFGLTRIVSLASMTAALALPLVVWLLGREGPILVVAAALAALAIYRHRANLTRLWQGTEPRVGGPSESRKEAS